MGNGAEVYTERPLHARIRAAVAAALATAVAPPLACIAQLEQGIARLKKNSSNSSKPHWTWCFRAWSFILFRSEQGSALAIAL
jgi:hypothetical protein